jgi:hypothetical protein
VTSFTRTPEVEPRLQELRSTSAPKALRQYLQLISMTTPVHMLYLYKCANIVAICEQAQAYLTDTCQESHRKTKPHHGNIHLSLPTPHKRIHPLRNSNSSAQLPSILALLPPTHPASFQAPPWLPTRHVELDWHWAFWAFQLIHCRQSEE